MPEDKNTPAEVVTRNPGHRFPEGHARFGGRKKATARAAREMAAKMGVDPMQFMLEILRSDVIKQTVIVDGKKKRVEVPIDLDTRLDAATTLMPYLYPRLTAQQVTGKDEGPLEVAALDVTKVLSDPAMLSMAQNLALALAGQRHDAVPHSPNYALLTPGPAADRDGQAITCSKTFRVPHADDESAQG